MTITYTYHLLQMLEERRLNTLWVERVINDPDWLAPDPTQLGATRAYKAIPERGDRFMRVVYIVEGDETRVLTAFLDRGARPPW